MNFEDEKDIVIPNPKFYKILTNEILVGIGVFNTKEVISKKMNVLCVVHRWLGKFNFSLGKAWTQLLIIHEYFLPRRVEEKDRWMDRLDF